MDKCDIIQQIMFDWDKYSVEELFEMTKDFPLKLLRYIAMEHPDNFVRKAFFRVTNVTIGKDAVINRGLTISDNYESLVFIGDRVAIATNVTLICDSNPNNSHLKNFTKIQERLIYTKKIIIESDCWIGANATILGGVKIGQYSIVGAGSVVTTDVDSYSIYAGVPARKLRSIR